jgi:TonB-dependent starch-binding outer membrane protein SusC
MRKFLLLSWLCFAAILAQAQTKTIIGKVTDSKSGVPLGGITVSTKGGQVGTQTKDDGTFSINVPNAARALVFSSVGYEEIEASITNSSVLNVAMGPGNGKRLDEVVVVAYGSQSKRKITGSVATVNSEDLENRPFASVDQMLQGKVAGLQSVSPNGQPGAAQTIRIRGFGSITGNNDPLIVVDGIPVNTGDFSRLSTTSNTLAGLNPNDIESVSVLKDAAAASIYGSRAAAGVLLITTKKGRAGKTKLRVDAEYGLSNIAFLNDLGKPLNRQEYFDLTREGLINAGATTAQQNATLTALGYNNNYDENWFDRVTRQGQFSSFNVSASGGEGKTTFYTSAGYYKQESPVIGSDFKRYSGNVNIRHRASDKVALAFNITGGYTQQQTPTNSSLFRNPVMAIYTLRPSQNAYNPDGTVNYDIAMYNQTFNPLAILEYDRQAYRNFKTISTASLEYDIVKNLKFTSKFGVDFFTIEEERYDNPFFGDGRTSGGRIYQYDTRVTNWVWTNMLDFHHDFLADNALGLDLKIGHESQKNKQYNVTAAGTGVPLTTLIQLPAPSTPISSLATRTDASLESQFSILQLNYHSKYSLSGSFRRDGSSRFPTESRWGNFYSVGAAWNIDQEGFLSSNKIIDALKLRASYGTNGDNRGTGAYEWRATYSFASGNNYNQQPGTGPNAVGNPELTWEKNKVFNVGLDFAVLNNRINGTIEYYNRRTDDLIFNVPLSPTSGLANVISNFGSMENKGWEFSFNFTPVKTKDLKWDIGFNIALNRNKILSLPNNNADIRTGNLIRRVGEDAQSIYTRLWAGVNSATGAAEWWSDSTKTLKTGTVPSKRGIIGSSSPRGFGGFSTNLTYKGFSLDAQFTYQYGHYIYDQLGFIAWSDGAFGSFNQIRKQLGRWQKPGDITDIPKYIYGNTTASNAESSRWYYKGDFIRLRDLTLSYSIPKSISDRLKISNSLLYVRGSNLWTKAFDKGIIFDPEQGFSGNNSWQVLIQRTVTLGLTLGF